MRKMVAIVALATAGFGGQAVAAGPEQERARASAKVFTIHTGQFKVTRLGRLITASSRTYSPTLGHAIRAFGQPSNTFRHYGGCVGKWRRLGLRIEFYNFGYGGVGRHPCEPEVGRAQSFSIRNSRRWRTWKGLRIGMSEERLWDIHPYADWFDGNRYYDEGYWLRWNYSPFGDESEYPVLAAHLGGNGRVKSFSGWIGAAGE